MSSPQQQQQQLTSINPTSLKIRFACRFIHALNTINKKRSSSPHKTQIYQRSYRVKLAAYASMASVVGPKRAWSRAILRKIRNRGGHVLARNKKRGISIHHHNIVTIRRRRRNPNREHEHEHVDPFGNSGQEVKLRKLVPGAKKMDPCGLLDETADYIKCLATQVEVMRTLVDLYSTI